MNVLGGSLINFLECTLYIWQAGRGSSVVDLGPPGTVQWVSRLFVVSGGNLDLDTTVTRNLESRRGGGGN